MSNSGYDPTAPTDSISQTETSPSAGWREIAHALDAPEAHVADAHPTTDDREYLEDVPVAEDDRDPAPAEVAG
jgi:hypothetical protein